MTERLEFKAALTVDDTGEITGMAWPFGSPDRVGDVIEKGAISMPASVPMLFAHDQGQVIGIWDQLTENSDGLTVKGRLLVEDVERAREVRAMIRSKAVTGLSIGFVTKTAKPRQHGRTITALNLHEISVVAIPCHPGAQITSIKAADGTATQKENHMENELENTQAPTADPVIEKKDFDALKARLDKMEAKANRPVAANNNNPDGSNDNIERKALASFVRTGSDIEVKAAASDSNVDGGYFVLPTVDLSIRSLMTDLSPLRGLAEVVTISSDTYERFYSLGKRGAQRVSQRDDRPQDTARPELIKHSYGVGEYYAAPAATRHLLDDASVDIAAWLLDNAVHDFAETEGEDFLTYTGMDGFPRGLLDYPTAATKDFTREWGMFQFVPAGHASAPTDDNLAKALIALVSSLRRPYKGNARFLMNSATALRLRQIQDTTKRFLWAPTGNLIEGIDHPLLGFRVEIDDNMPDIGENAFPVAFGDFRQGYVIVDRHGIRVERDSVTVKGRILFDTYKRVGGGAGDFNAIKFLKIAAA
ncbi:phage prohead protease, HK97 family/phage major capsid protein, HK97 family [Hoeflea sp. IMCC20628]|uniref:phage major capsid protein n=1 Tax=Hoeflea sp. IMCC20628 TaxID=1620421 RepID=UPI00063AB59B|nr:phage major capsid protein [Hoeflea sp. IMCC20628]AKI01427.1 phage prohead protease, HK97 family/phage major capsid protein, HK97 family [Hoeflea sp. IMCC20628]